MRAFLISLLLLILSALLIPVASTASPPAQAECPEITIETPSTTVCPDARINFTARVTKGEMNAQQRFKWTVSEGRIVKGHGTSTITVEATGVQGPGGLRVSVELVRPEVSCPLTFTRAVDVTPLCPERKFDEYGNLSFEEEKARLGLFAAQLRGTPDTMGLIVIRESGKSDADEASARLERARNYLVNELGLEAERIYTKEGEFREELAIELWIMPTKVPPAGSNQNLNSSPSP